MFITRMDVVICTLDAEYMSRKDFMCTLDSKLLTIFEIYRGVLLDDDG